MGPSGILYFEPLKKHVASKRFATDTDVKQAVASRLQTLGADFFYVGIQTSLTAQVGKMFICQW
jgi:hypothetical protein